MEEMKLPESLHIKKFEETVNRMFEDMMKNEASALKDQDVISLKEQDVISLMYYGAVQRFKSVRRAIRRGHVSPSGVIYPKRPFNNRKRGPGTITYERKKVYEQFRNAGVE
jgi:hypothetical protein